jgi:hypothetical protein
VLRLAAAAARRSPEWADGADHAGERARDRDDKLAP